MNKVWLKEFEYKYTNSTTSVFRIIIKIMAINLIWHGLKFFFFMSSFTIITSIHNFLRFSPVLTPSLPLYPPPPSVQDCSRQHWVRNKHILSCVPPTQVPWFARAYHFHIMLKSCCLIVFGNTIMKTLTIRQFQWSFASLIEMWKLNINIKHYYIVLPCFKQVIRQCNGVLELRLTFFKVFTIVSSIIIKYDFTL